MRDAGAWAQFINSATMFGRTGVDLFFVLSGFLIIGILVDRRDEPNVFRVFYARRFLRIHPPYLVLIGLYWLCYWMTGPNVAFNTEPSLPVQLLAQFTLTWNWLMAAYDAGVANGFSVTWSIGIEEWFYLLFPSLIVFSPARTLGRVLLLIALSSIAARAAMYLIRPDLWLAPYVLTPFRLDGLCAGGLIAIAVRDPRWPALARRYAKNARYAALALLLPVPVLIALIRPDLMMHMSLWGHTYLTLAYAVLLLAVLSDPGTRLGGVLRWRGFTRTGRYSYSLYLFHPLFISLVFVVAGRRELIQSWMDVALATIALALSVAFVVGLYHGVERHALAFGKTIRYGSSRGDAREPSPFVNTHRTTEAEAKSLPE